MGSYVARRDEWTILADLVYKGVEDSGRSTANLLGIPIRTGVEVGITQPSAAAIGFSMPVAVS